MSAGLGAGFFGGNTDSNKENVVEEGFILSESDGKAAVYFEDGAGPICVFDDILIEDISGEEAEKLRRGIYAKNYIELNRVIEEYRGQALTN